MRKLKLAVTILAAILLTGSASESGTGTIREDRVARAVFAHGKLWLLSKAGELFTITEGKDSRDFENFGEPVLDMCLQDGHPVVVACETKTCDSWRIFRRYAGGWSTVDSVKREGEKFVAMGCERESIGILASRSFIESKGDQQTTVALSNEISGGARRRICSKLPIFSSWEEIRVSGAAVCGASTGTPVK
jgi:hypothetical protein